ncbi:MAG: glycosyltransferase family A protein [Pseudomonadota bacterium]
MMDRLVICVPTYRRNLELSELLVELQRQTIPPESEVETRILVIDNNPAGEAEAVVSAAHGPIRIDYIHESQPGVVHVRNRALTACAMDRFLVFIDDDELPDADWLVNLWLRRVQSRAAVVFGTVEARYEGAVPGWMAEGDFHSKHVFEDGPRTTPGATDNCLIDLHVVRTHNLRFDPGLSLIGGEDTLFFDALLLAGENFADAARARTFERIPENRATLDWLRRRWRRTGLTDAMMIARRRGGGPLNGARAFVDGALRVAVGCGLCMFAWLAGGGSMSAELGRRLYTVERGLGMLDFVFGREVREYARPQTPAKA